MLFPRTRHRAPPLLPHFDQHMQHAGEQRGVRFLLHAFTTAPPARLPMSSKRGRQIGKLPIACRSTYG
jgi:hypothetical protein